MKISLRLYLTCAAILITFSSFALAGEIYVRDNTIYSTDGNKVIVSYDLGKNWQDITPNGAKYITSLFASDANDIYVGTATYRADFPPFHEIGGGLWISHNQGQNWSLLTTENTPGFAGNWIHTIYATKVDKNTNIYVGTYGGGLSISQDNGKTWSTYAANIPGWISNWVTGVYGNGKDIYALTTYDPDPNNNIKKTRDFDTDGGLMFSHDGGNTWQNKLPGLDFGSDWTTDLNVVGDNIYVSTYDWPGGIAVSHLGGKRDWQRIAVQGYDDVRNVKVIGETLFVLTDQHGLLLSNNNGENWKTLIDQSTAPQALYVDNNKLYVRTYRNWQCCTFDPINKKWICGILGRNL